MSAPATLGQFTGQLGTPLSFLGNIELATPGGIVPPPSVPPVRVVFLKWHADTTPLLTWNTRRGP